MLMNSKFNKCSRPDDEQLIATGGHSGIVTVWRPDNCKDVASLNHEQTDPNFEGLEIDWQNGKSLAVTGKSRNIFLWNLDTPLLPQKVWSGGHSSDVEQIKWDPSGQILASSSQDNLVCLWKPDKSTPVEYFD